MLLGEKNDKVGILDILSERAFEVPQKTTDSLLLLIRNKRLIYE